MGICESGERRCYPLKRRAMEPGLHRLFLVFSASEWSQMSILRSVTQNVNSLPYVVPMCFFQLDRRTNI